MIKLSRQHRQILSAKVDSHIDNVNKILVNKDISNWAFVYWNQVKMKLLQNKESNAKSDL